MAKTKEEKEENRKRRQTIFSELAKKRQEAKKEKQEIKIRVAKEYAEQKRKRKELLIATRDDIAKKRQEMLSQIKSKQVAKATAKAEFKKYRTERIKQYKDTDNQILFEASEELHNKFGYRIRRLFFGIGKEFTRISWSTGRRTIQDFGIIIMLGTILALIFLAIDTILSVCHILG